MHIPKIKLSRDLGCLKTRPDLDFSSPVFNKHTRKNAAGKKRKALTMFRFVLIVRNSCNIMFVGREFVAGAPNKLFCKIAVLQRVFRWESWSSFMFCRQDEIHLLGDFFKNFLWNGYYRREAMKILFRTLDSLWKYDEIMDVRYETHIIRSCYAVGWEKH